MAVKLLKRGSHVTGDERPFGMLCTNCAECLECQGDTLRASCRELRRAGSPTHLVAVEPAYSG
eukprot:3169775-Prorocentrum_lima.AAC.1